MHQKPGKKLPKEISRNISNEKFNALVFDKDSNFLVGNKI